MRQHTACVSKVIECQATTGVAKGKREIKLRRGVRIAGGAWGAVFGKELSEVVLKQA